MGGSEFSGSYDTITRLAEVSNQEATALEAFAPQPFCRSIERRYIHLGIIFIRNLFSAKAPHVWSVSIVAVAKSSLPNDTF